MVKEWKKELARKLAEEIDRYEVVGIASIENLPSKQLQILRKKLRGKVLIKVAKNSIIRHALRHSKKEGIEKLEEHIQGPTALVLSNLDAFKLFRLLKECRSKAPLKAGMIAPEDVVVPAGDTGLPPGPVMSEFKQAGLPIKVEKGTIHIAKDTVVVRKGEVVSKEVASVLSRLGIEPLEVFLKLNASYEGGLIFTRDVLDVSTEEILQEMASANQKALNLALQIGYVCHETLPLLLSKAHGQAVALALHLGILTRETVLALISKAHAQALALANILKGEEEKKVEEEKEEVEEEKEEAVSGLAALFG